MVVDDPLVAGAETLEDRHRLTAVGALDRQLDVGQHPIGVGVGDQQGTVLAAGGAGELVAVDEPHTRLQRVDAEAGPGEVEERHRRQHGAVDALVGAQQGDGVFEDEWRSGDGVEDLAVLDGRGDEALDDLGVHILEAVGRFVDVIETRRPGDDMGARVSGGAQVAVADPLDRRQRLGGDVPVAARPQPDDGDRAGHRPVIAGERRGASRGAAGNPLRGRRTQFTCRAGRRRSWSDPSARSAN